MSDDQEGPGALTVRPDRPARRIGRAGKRRRDLRPAGVEPPAAALQPSLPAWPEAPQPVQILLETRRRRRRRFFLQLALFVGLPTLAILLYTLVVATPRYVSEFEITYQTYGSPQRLSTGLVQTVLGERSSNSVELSAILYEYIRSPALLEKLDAELHLRQYYSSSKVDYLSRMAKNASPATFLLYYRWFVSVSQGSGGYLTIDVQAFDQAFAKRLATAIVTACDKMVDGMSARARKDEVKFAEQEVTREEDRVRKARAALTHFQNAHGDLDPQSSATDLGKIAAGLEGQLSAARSQLTDALSYMSPTSPTVVQLKLKITALETQLRQERARLANTDGKTPYSQILDQYSALQLEEDFARSAYQAAQQGLAVARANAIRQQNYLIDFAPPSQPDKATVYIPVVYTLTVLLIALVAFGIGSLLTGAFRDQAGI
jgi:capsular polysaccharide transport system permease protein